MFSSFRLMETDLVFRLFQGPSPNYRLSCLFIGFSVHRLQREWLILNAVHNDPRPREPLGARFAWKRETSTDGFTRQWSLALSDNLETVLKLGVLFKFEEQANFYKCMHIGIREQDYARGQANFHLFRELFSVIQHTYQNLNLKRSLKGENIKMSLNIRVCCTDFDQFFQLSL